MAFSQGRGARLRTLIRRRRMARRGRRRRRAAVRGAGFAAVGDGTTVMQPAVIHGAERIHLGRDVTILPGSFLSVIEQHHGRSYAARLVIGDRSELGRDLVIACFGSVEIGPDVLAADRVFIGDTYRDYRDATAPVRNQPLVEPRPVRIGAGAFLGINSCVMPGVTIGDRAYVGAGAVVTADVPDHAVVAGNPAVVVRAYDPTSGSWVRP